MSERKRNVVSHTGKGTLALEASTSLVLRFLALDETRRLKVCLAMRSTLGEIDFSLMHKGNFDMYLKTFRSSYGAGKMDVLVQMIGIHEQALQNEIDQEAKIRQIWWNGSRR